MPPYSRPFRGLGPMTSDTDRYLLDLFRQSGDWSDAELETIGYVFGRHVKEGEDLLRMLIRVKVFQRTGVQVIDMMQAGQLKPPHLSFLFHSTGAKLLKNSLRIEGARRVAREAALAAPPATPASPSGRMSPFAAPGSSSRLIAVNGGSSSVRLANPSSSSFSISNSTAVMDRTPRVGMVLGKCLLTGLLGQGGNGKVFSGLHQTLNIQVAIKVLTSEDAELSQEQIDRLAREAQLLARLNHPNVIRVLDYDDSPIPYVTMEFVEGLSLADLIEQTGGLRVPRTSDMMIQVANGLAAAWEVGLVHRDIKPGNILLTKSGIAKVTDLGLAFKFGSDTGPPIRGTDSSLSPLGTCGYISPEQAVNDPSIDFRTDIYSLGATFYHAVRIQEYASTPDDAHEPTADAAAPRGPRRRRRRSLGRHLPDDGKESERPLRELRRTRFRSHSPRTRCSVVRHGNEYARPIVAHAVPRPP